MNRINPLYVLVLLFVVFLMLMYKLDVSKEELKATQSDYKSTEALAIKLSSLKEVYSDKTNIKKSLEKILKHSALKSSSLDTKFKNSSLIITAKSIDKNSLNLLVSKLVNNSFIINKMKVRKLSENSAELSMEIKW